MQGESDRHPSKKLAKVASYQNHMTIVNISNTIYATL